jgi:hypothetical protein
MRFFYLLLLLTACAGAPSNPVAPDALEPEPVPTARTPDPVATEAQRIEEVQLLAIDTAESEDGFGNLVTSTLAIAIEIQTEGWPGKAMDPVLVVGEARFTHYSHPSPTVIRFVVADPALLPAGAEAIVRYGEREVARFTLPAHGATP